MPPYQSLGIVLEMIRLPNSHPIVIQVPSIFDQCPRFLHNFRFILPFGEFWLHNGAVRHLVRCSEVGKVATCSTKVKRGDLVV
jgi:hypothetical protein